MSDQIPWTPYDPDWVPLPDEQRRLWTPEQVQIYDTYTWRNEARRTPADFGRVVKAEWIDLQHIIYISNLIADFINDRLIAPNGKPARKLFLTMPPRHGKSFLLSEVVPAWFLSMYPNRRVILTTYESSFAAEFGEKARDTLMEHGPKFGLSVSPSTKAKDNWRLNKPHLGGMTTAGMGGPITGKGGGLLIGDDWVKNSDEANSEAWRRSAWNWYNTTFKTRFQKDLNDPTAPPPKMILLMTRWHEDDPMGRLLSRQEMSGDMVVIHLPALAVENDPLGRKPGEALCPQIMSAEELRSLKAEDPASFEALYQGNPTLEEGGLFSKSKFRHWSYAQGGEPGAPAPGAYLLHTPEGTKIPYSVSDCKHFITTDLAISKKTSADYTVFTLWAVTPDRDLVLVSRFRDRIEEAQHLPTLQRFHDEATTALGGRRPRLVGVEKQTYGLSLISKASRGSNMSIRALDVDTDKVSRAIPAGQHVSNGKVYLPEHADWIEEFISECTSFPNGAHDDQVDCLSYAVEVLNTTFWTVRSRSEPEPEPGVDDRIQRNIDKIAKRNAAQRRRNRSRWAGV